jgi:5-methylcytosine-specific restriction endonuclease McrA
MGLAFKKGELLSCFTCGKKTYRSPASVNKHVFCSHNCSAKWSNTLRIGEKHPLYTGNGYRRIALRIYGLKCDNKEKCPLKDKKLPSFMYDVDHRDGNHSNHKIENLRVLCVWCHRQTDTFGGRNKKIESRVIGNSDTSEVSNFRSES